MKEITITQQLLSKRGALISPGYSRHMNYVYDKNNVKNPNKLKEWDFYQILFGRQVLQVTIGHVSYSAQISANLFDLDTGKRRSFCKTVNVDKVKAKMPANPETPHVLQYFSKNLHFQAEVTDKYRRISLTSTDRRGICTEIDVMLTNCSKAKEKMVIATPFAKPTQFYLNYKENCFVANGICRIEDACYLINDGFGLIDWGRGVWPFKHQWIWGNGGTVVDGKHFGFNIGWGFGNTSAATENMFFYDNKAYKLGTVTQTTVDGKVAYADGDHRFEFTVQPIFDNFTKTKMLWVNNKCHQVFGTWQGYVILDDGTRLDVPPFIAFCEHAVNRW